MERWREWGPWRIHDMWGYREPFLRLKDNHSVYYTLEALSDVGLGAG